MFIRVVYGVSIPIYDTPTNVFTLIKLEEEESNNCIVATAALFSKYLSSCELSEAHVKETLRKLQKYGRNASVSVLRNGITITDHSQLRSNRRKYYTIPSYTGVYEVHTFMRFLRENMFFTLHTRIYITLHWFSKYTSTKDYRYAPLPKHLREMRALCLVFARLKVIIPRDLLFYIAQMIMY